VSTTVAVKPVQPERIERNWFPAPVFYEPRDVRNRPSLIERLRVHPIERQDRDIARGPGLPLEKTFCGRGNVFAAGWHVTTEN
jgi:hypothetical protein